jgi:hypothetical protein
MAHRAFCAVIVALVAAGCHGRAPVDSERPAPVEPPRRELMHRHNVVTAALSGDGARLATGSVAGEVLIWSTRPLAPVRDLPPPASRGKISALALSTDGSEALVAADWKPIVERWDVVAGVKRGELAAHTGRTTAIAYAPAGGWIATGGADRAAASGAAGDDDDPAPPLEAPRVRLWQAGAIVRELAGLTRRIGAIAFNGDGSLVAAGGEGAVKIWRTGDGAEVASHALPGESATVAFRGDQLCAASSEAAACFPGPGGQPAAIADARAPTRAAVFTAGWLATGTFDAVDVRDAGGALRATFVGRAYAIVGAGDDLWAVLADQVIAVRAGKVAAPFVVKAPAP